MNVCVCVVVINKNASMCAKSKLINAQYKVWQQEQQQQQQQVAGAKWVY